MNQTIIELKLGINTKEQAAQVLAYIQAMCTGSRDQTLGIGLHALLESFSNVISATYRERRDHD